MRENEKKNSMNFCFDMKIICLQENAMELQEEERNIFCIDMSIVSDYSILFYTMNFVTLVLCLITYPFCARKNPHFIR